MTPYAPDPLPPANIDYGPLVGLVGRANAELARYDGLLQGIVNPGVLLSPLTTQEAVLSSRIEGTRATLDEVLEHEAGQPMPPEKSQDIQEIANYRAALVLAAEELAHRPISLSLVKQMHGLLMNSVRGAEKQPGQFRRDQNWIGPPGCVIEDASFVPPGPLRLLDHLEAWEAYIGTEDLDGVAQAAIVHAQFELIHPFNDGNGRIGRLLIPLFLTQRRLLGQPMFYLSGYLESHRDAYYHRLSAISDAGDWSGWLRFFLSAVIEQAQENASKVRAILALYDEMKARIVAITHSQYAIHALDAIFDRPIFLTTDFVVRSGIPTRATALGLLRQMQRAGILSVLQKGSGRRPARLCFPHLINLAEGRTVV